MKRRGRKERIYEIKEDKKKALETRKQEEI
jgi:hypothetical protein